MKTLLFYDISELGWVRYLSAHLNYLTKKGIKVAICTNKSREVFYRGFVDEILPIPEKYYEMFGHLQSDGNCLYNPITDEIINNHNIISKPFKDAYPEYEVVTDYSMFFGERIFEPYKHSIDSEKFCEKFKKTILVFPRYREFKFGRRNLPKEYWIKTIETLCKNYKDLDIITFGGLKSTYNIDLPYKNYHNLVPMDDNLDILIALCNTKKALLTFGTESGIMLVTIVCKTPSFIIGEGKERILRENFTKTDIYCYQVKETENGYKIHSFDDLLKNFLNFVNVIKFYSEGGQI
jgi:ADP-heptose:LPS heptosyltransferase